MFDNAYSTSNDRPRGALEVAIRARSQEKSLALTMSDYRAETMGNNTEKTKKNKGLIGSLIAILRAI